MSQTFFVLIAIIAVSMYRGVGAIKLGSRVPIAEALKIAEFPPAWPYNPRNFARQDETEDTNFYSQPRFVYHIDDGAVKALTNYYKEELRPNTDILDICSSWVSHYPKDLKFKSVVGLGMNLPELQANTQLTNFVVQDLNKNPIFPLQDNSFDYVTCVVSVDYLNRPLEVFKEIRRVLRSGGKAIISQSNRCFPSKAIDIWLNTNDVEHGVIIASYFHYAGGFEKAVGIDISPSSMFGDPMFIVEATKI